MRRYLVVTLDTEVDKDRHWRVADPASFDSVRVGIPHVLSPLFDDFGVIPTYLLSAEVMEDPESVAVLGRLRSGELGTHLHAEFVDPGRELRAVNMAGQPTDAVQCQYPRDVERGKLASLTELFCKTFGRAPTSFRAGRFGLSPNSLELLAGLGYRVDSSVTPGLRWRYRQVTLDYRGWTTAPAWASTASGRILELPVGIIPARRLVSGVVERLPGLAGRAVGGVLGSWAQASWLRPSWATGPELIRYVERSSDQILVLMLHSMEIVPGRSPYASSAADVDRIVGALRELFVHCERRDIGFCGLTEAARLA